MHDLRAAAGHLEEFVVGDRIDLARLRHHPRIAGVNAVHIGVDLANVGLQRRRDGDRRQVGPAAAERGDLPLVRLPLEPGDDADIPFLEVVFHLPRGDVGDLGFRVDAACDDAGLRAGERDRLAAERIDRHRGEGDRGLLAGGEEHIHLALGRAARNLAGELDQAIRHPRHRRNHHHHRVPLPLRGEDPPRHIHDPLGIADGSAAEFLDDQCHGKIMRSPRAPLRAWHRPRGVGNCRGERRSRCPSTHAP